MVVVLPHYQAACITQAVAHASNKNAVWTIAWTICSTISNLKCKARSVTILYAHSANKASIISIGLASMASLLKPVSAPLKPPIHRIIFIFIIPVMNRFHLTQNMPHQQHVATAHISPAFPAKQYLNLYVKPLVVLAPNYKLRPRLLAY